MSRKGNPYDNAFAESFIKNCCNLGYRWYGTETNTVRFHQTLQKMSQNRHQQQHLAVRRKSDSVRARRDTHARSMPIFWAGSTTFLPTRALMIAILHVWARSAAEPPLRPLSLKVKSGLESAAARSPPPGPDARQCTICPIYHDLSYANSIRPRN